jgi:hypothetical protein
MSMARFSVPQNKLKVGHYATFQTRRDAEQVFEAARAAMDVCKRLVGGDAIVYPRVDPIVTYTVQPEDSWSLVECARVHAMPRKLSIECTLDGTYFFGHHAVSKRDMMSGLSRVFENHPGDAAWRARGLIAPNLSAAVERSRGVVGESVVMFIHGFMADEDNGHAVTAALRATTTSRARCASGATSRSARRRCTRSRWRGRAGRVTPGARGAARYRRTGACGSS